MRVHVGDPNLVEPLLEYFAEQADCVALQVGEVEIDVALLGSYGNDAHAAAVEQLVSDFRRSRTRANGHLRPLSRG